MKNLFVVSLSMVALLFFIDPAFGVRIKVATKAPENFKSARIMKKMFREIKEKTDGNVNFKVYYGGVKGSGRDLLLKMKSGEIQGGDFTSGEAASVVRDLEIMSTPLTFKDYGEVDHVFEKMTPHLKDQMEERGYVVLGWHEIGFAYIMSAKPIASLQDLRNKKIWIPQGDHVGRAVFEAIGVPPVSMTIADVTLALQTGQIDTVTNSFVGAIALQWHTGIKYVTDIPLLYVYGLFMITREAYDNIPAVYRQTVHEILDRYFNELKTDIRNGNRDSALILRRRGIQFVPATAENYRELDRVIQGVKNELLGKEFSDESNMKLQRYIEEYRNTRAEGK